MSTDAIQGAPAGGGETPDADELLARHRTAWIGFGAAGEEDWADQWEKKGRAAADEIRATLAAQTAELESKERAHERTYRAWEAERAQLERTIAVLDEALNVGAATADDLTRRLREMEEREAADTARLNWLEFTIRESLRGVASALVHHNGSVALWEPLDDSIPDGWCLSRSAPNLRAAIDEGMGQDAARAALPAPHREEP